MKGTHSTDHRGNSNRCASCGVGLSGPWCSSCGERARRPGDISLREYLGDLLEGLTNLNGRFWASLRALIVRPGLLTCEYMDGRRVLWMRPLHLFLFINLVYFLLASWDTFSTPLQTHMTAANFPHRAVAERLVTERLDIGLSTERWHPIIKSLLNGDVTDLDDEQLDVRGRLREYTLAFNRTGELLARSLVIVLIPLATLLLLPVGLLRRQSPPLTQLILATHWVAFLLIASLVTGMLFELVVRLNLMNFDPRQADLVVSLVLAALLSLWTMLAFRRVYQFNWPIAVLLAVVISTIGTLALIQTYRMVLFFAVHFSLRGVH